MCLNLKNEMKISFLTYGCKVNQYETELIRQMMLGGGLTEAADPGGADIYLVNTCTVTAKIDSEISGFISGRDIPGKNIRA